MKTTTRDNKVPGEVPGEDLTPTWEQLLPAMVGALTEIPNGTDAQRKARATIWSELRRMARTADRAVRSAEEAPEPKEVTHESQA
jgi:hypothetical protein